MAERRWAGTRVSALAGVSGSGMSLSCCTAAMAAGGVYVLTCFVDKTALYILGKIHSRDSSQESFITYSGSLIIESE